MKREFIETQIWVTDYTNYNLIVKNSDEGSNLKSLSITFHSGNIFTYFGFKNCSNFEV